MTAHRIIVSILAISAVHFGASAQGPAKQHAALSAKPTMASAWTCQTKQVEIAPVSYDSSGAVSAWVMVHRVKGEIIASERVSQQEVDQIRRLPCAGDTLNGRPPPLVG